MKKTNVVVGTCVALLLAACGGGGGESTPPVTASKMAPYFGNWVGPCEGREKSYLTISETPGVKDGATYYATTGHYAEVGCTGLIVATETYTANFSAVYSGSTDASVVFTPGSAGVSTKIDKVTLSVPAYRHVLTGSGVTHPTVNGVPEWCVAYADGTSSCFIDELSPGYAGYMTSTYVSGNKLHVLIASGAGYNAEEVWTKR